MNARKNTNIDKVGLIEQDRDGMTEGVEKTSVLDGDLERVNQKSQGKTRQNQTEGKSKERTEREGK